MFDGDDEDDSMAANPEPAMHVTTEPRRRKPPAGEGVGRWEIVWRDGVQVDDVTAQRERAAKLCRMCGDPDPSGVLHSVGDDIRRNVCAPCAGVYNLGRV